LRRERSPKREILVKVRILDGRGAWVWGKDLIA